MLKITKNQFEQENADAVCIEGTLALFKRKSWDTNILVQVMADFPIWISSKIPEPTKIIIDDSHMGLGLPLENSSLPESIHESFGDILAFSGLAPDVIIFRDKHRIKLMELETGLRQYPTRLSGASQKGKKPEIFLL